jgi:hypothetical protein
MSAYQINDWNELPKAIVTAEAVGMVGLAELLRALRDGRIALLPLHPDTSPATFEFWSRATRHRPAILLVGDDDGLNRGPDAWPLADSVLQWSARVVIHAAAARREDYQDAIATAQIHGRVTLIESCDRTADAWVARIAAMATPRQTLLIAPQSGPHPAAPDRRDVQ